VISLRKTVGRSMAVILAAGVLSASAASAAKPAPAAAPDDKTVLAMHIYGACIADRTRYGAEQVLEMDPSDRSAHRMLEKLAEGHPGCEPGREIKFNDALFRGGLAERMLAKRPGREHLLATLSYDPGKKAIHAWDEVDVAGLCVVRKDPQAVAALLDTEPASAAEAQAEQALAPSLGACLKAGQTVQLSRSTFRAMLAVAAWQVADAAGAR
jgi:hypothetical protein